MFTNPFRGAPPCSRRGRLPPSIASAPLLLLALYLAACAEPPGSLVIVQNQRPVVSETGGGCVISAEDTSTFNSAGEFDVDLDGPYPYLVYPLIKNRLPSRITAGVERNSMLLTGINVSIKAPAGVNPGWLGGCPGNFSVDAVGQMDPGTSRAIGIVALRTCHAQRLRQLIEEGAIPSDLAQPVFFTVELTAIADRNGSDERSPPFPFGIQVCAGCLQALYPLTPACADTPKPNPLPGNPCNIAQDGPKVLCCTDPAGALMCPAPDM